LGLDVIVWVTVHGDGSRMTLRVSSPLGQQAPMTLEFQGQRMRDLAFSIVSELANATGVLDIRSDPPGATVLLDGQAIGTTPMSYESAAGVLRLEVALDDYGSVERSVELRPGETRRVDFELAQMVGELTVVTHTPGAVLTLNGERFERANQTLRIEPGDYTVVLEAPGFTPQTRQFTIAAGEARTLQVTLQESPEAIRAREMNYIYERPFFVRAAFRFSGSRNGLGGSTGELDGEEHTVVCPQGNSGGCDDGTATNRVGILGEIGVSFRYFELTLIGLGYDVSRIGGSSGDGRPFTLTDTQDNTLTGIVSSVSRFSLHPLQLGGRYLFNQHWGIFGRFGFGWYSEFFGVDELGTDRSGDFSRQGWTWGADVGARYHLNDTMFLSAAMTLQGDLSHDDSGLVVGFDIGIGITWPDFIGITDWFGGDDE
ncbi:MAG: PEGA domain-containing protein, partial [Myxococcales bacterium]|nr:PEGA domain-containing protein [Myxococcales bacterium]